MSFTLPKIGEFFEEVVYADQPENKAKTIVDEYIKEGRSYRSRSGTGSEPPFKRSRFDDRPRHGGATTETEVMTTVEATDVEEVGVAVMEATRGLVVEGDPAVDMGEVVVEVTAVDVEEGVVTMIDEIIVAEEGEVKFYK